MRRLALATALALLAAPAPGRAAPGDLVLVAGSVGGDGGLATLAGLRSPSGLAVYPSADLLIADGYHHGLRHVRTDGTIANLVDDTMPIDVAVGPDGAVWWSALTFQTGGWIGAPIAGFFPADLWRLSPGGAPERVAGDGRCDSSADGTVALGARACPRAVAFAPDETVAFVEQDRVRAIDADGTLRTLAGRGVEGYSGDGGPATEAALSRPGGIAFDATGNLYIADTGNGRVRRVDTTGTITTVAGQQTADRRLRDRGIELQTPVDVAVAPDGAIFVADAGVTSWPVSRAAGGVLRLDPATGAVTPLTALPNVVAITAAAGSLYASTIRGYWVPHDFRSYERTEAYVWSIDALTGAKTLVAGSGNCCTAGDGGLAIHAELGRAGGVARAPDGSIWITDVEHDLVRRIAPDGTIARMAGDDSDLESACCYPKPPPHADPWLGPDRPLTTPTGTAFDAGSNAFVLESHFGDVLWIDPRTGLSRHVANVPDATGIGDDAAGRVYLSAYPDDSETAIVWRLDTLDGTLTRVAGAGACGDPPGDGGPALDAPLCGAGPVTGSFDGTLFIPEPGAHRVRRISPDGTISTVAGDGTVAGTGNGDGGPATEASVPFPWEVELDAAGNLFVGSQRLRVVRPDGAIETVLDRAIAPFDVTPAGDLLHTEDTLFFSVDHAYFVSKVWRLEGPL